MRAFDNAVAALDTYYRRDRLSGDAHRLAQPLADLIHAIENMSVDHRDDEDAWPDNPQLVVEGTL